MKLYEKRRGIRARMNTVMPGFQELFGRTAPFGVLDSSDIATILSDKRWFGDGQPKWRRAPTADDYERKWLKAVKSLSSKHFQSKFSDASRVAATVASCSPAKRCASNGCYLCCRAFQRWLIWAVKQLYRRPVAGYEDIAFNFVFPAGQAPISKLRDVDFDEISDLCAQAIERTNTVIYGVFAFDVSLNDDTAKFLRGVYKNPPEIYWQVHIYGTVRTNNPQAVFAALKSVYGSDEKIFAPIKRKRFDGSNYAISYIFKPESYRRIPFWFTQGKKDGWKIRGCRLKPSEQIELLIASHHLGFSHRVTLINLHPVKLTPTSKRGWGIGLRRTTPRTFGM